MSVSLTPLEVQTVPEKLAGGFDRRDGTLAFYQRIDSLLTPDMIVLDLGAGRGAQLEGQGYKTHLVRLQGRVKKLIGVDVDPAVHQNSYMDETRVISPSEPLPFEDETFDLIYSDWVIEHVENPATFVNEIYRVLKPGGWFCARTPSKWSYFALVARFVPTNLHGKILKQAQPDRNDEDVFPKFYRMNTLSAIQRAFDPSRFSNASYTHNPAPSYHGGNMLLYKAIDTYQSIPLKALDTTIHVFVQKRPLAS